MRLVIVGEGETSVCWLKKWRMRKEEVMSLLSWSRIVALMGGMLRLGSVSVSGFRESKEELTDCSE